MAHQPTSHEPANAIFSPSAARLAASNAREWAYVDSWMALKLPGRPPPIFERNADTLRVLLSLASVNEAADEDRSLLNQADSSSLRELTGHGADGALLNGLADGIISSVADDLPREGKVALDTMANIAVDSRIALPEPYELGDHLANLQFLAHQAEEINFRADILQTHIHYEISRTQSLVHDLQLTHSQPAPGLAKQNLDLQRKVKATTAQLPELCDRAALLASSTLATHPTVDQLAKDEKEYCEILAQRRQLDLQLAAFEGLHSDPEMARAELDILRNKLHGATTRRDAVFEGLVERESPVKRR